MNVDEATDVNEVLRYGLGISGPPGSDSESSARLAASRLAARAHATLHGGLTASQVLRAWGGPRSLLHVRRPPGSPKHARPRKARGDARPPEGGGA